MHLSRALLSRSTLGTAGCTFAPVTIAAVAATAVAIDASNRKRSQRFEFVRWIRCEEQPRKPERGEHENEDLFWQRLNGEGTFASGSTLRLLRQDALSKRWVCFMKEASTGGSKPRQYDKNAKRKTPAAHEQPQHDEKCPLCLGKEGDTEVLRVWPNGELREQEGAPKGADDKRRWLVRVLRNPFPYLLTPPDLYATEFPGDRIKHAACFGISDNEFSNPDAANPLYRMIDGIGASEVVVESPCHNALIGISTDEQVYHSLRAMAARGRTLRKNPHVRQLVYFKQYGAEAGGSLLHPHLQICSLPIVSSYMQTKLKEHQRFYQEHGCRAIQKLYVEDVCGGNSLAVSRLIYHTEHFVASIPFAQVARGRIVIAPRRPGCRFEDCTDDELKDLASLLRPIMAALYRRKNDPAYNLFWESAPTEQALDELGERDAVEKSFCWTLHIRVPPSISGFGLASGVEVTKQLPEEEARDMREAWYLEAQSPLRAELFDGLAAPKSQMKRSFPEVLGPLMMMQVDLARAFNAFMEEHDLRTPSPGSGQLFMAGFDLREVGMEEDSEVVCEVAPVHRITLHARDRAAACIPKAASYYSWVYPPRKSPDSPVLRLRGGSERAFLKNGGYIYFDADFKAVGTTSISSAAAGTSLIFGEPRSLPESAEGVLDAQSRFQEVTFKYMLSKGATHYAWIHPNEFGDDVYCPHGCFAYRFQSGPCLYYPVER